MIKLVLIPVQVFGAKEGEEEWGYGLCDAVGGQSDCNRAIGHIFRVATIDETEYLKPGEFLIIDFPDSHQAQEFLIKNWDLE